MKRSDIEATILLRNNTPLDIFYGLTPNEMDHLMYDTFDDRSPIQFRPDISDATLDKIPFFRLAEAFVKIVQREKRMKLTPSGLFKEKCYWNYMAMGLPVSGTLRMIILKFGKSIIGLK